MDYKKCWDTLKAESGGRRCQPHPLSNELLTIGELMRNMERRASEQEESPADSPASPVQQTQPAICDMWEREGDICPVCPIDISCGSAPCEIYRKQQASAQ